MIEWSIFRLNTGIDKLDYLEYDNDILNLEG